MAAFHLWTREDNAEALALFRRAIELDPDFAAAYGMAARCYLQRKAFGWVVDRAAEIAEAERLARARRRSGATTRWRWAMPASRWPSSSAISTMAPRCIERALQLNPNLAWVWQFSAWPGSGRRHAGLDHAARAMRLSPHDPQMFAMRTATAVAHFFDGRGRRRRCLGRRRQPGAARSS